MITVGFDRLQHLVRVVHLAAAPETAQVSPRVQFQGIIHDGLVGSSYLERFRMTFDVTGSRLVLAARQR